MGNGKIYLRMKRFIGNILIRALLHSSYDLKATLYDVLKRDNASFRYKQYKIKYTISDTFRFNGLDIQFYGDGKIICGDNSYIGNFSTIQTYDGYKVSIGNNCAISHNVRIYTTSNATDQNMNTILPKKKIYDDVFIGNGVWIGANVFIVGGVSIGDNVVVGANAVVTKNLEEDGIYAGVPAKLIKKKSL